MHKAKFFLLIFCALIVLDAGCSSGDSAVANNSAQTSGDATAAASQPIPITDARSALDEGNRLLDRGETDRAIEVLQQAVEMDPDLADAYFQLGIAYALVEKRDADKVETEVTPTPDPKQKKVREYKTNSEKAFENAVKAYKKIIAANEDDHAAHYNLGRAYNKLNEDEDAAKSLKEAVKLNPEDTEYQTELGAILIKLAQYHEAIPPLKKALELDPDNLRAEELLSDAQAGRKRVDYAKEKNEEKRAEANKSNTDIAPRSSQSAGNANSPTTPKKAPTQPAFPANTVN
jgi:tetratricopeptide (TPR) repeat protein